MNGYRTPVWRPGFCKRANPVAGLSERAAIPAAHGVRSPLVPPA